MKCVLCSNSAQSSNCGLLLIHVESESNFFFYYWNYIDLLSYIRKQTVKMKVEYVFFLALIVDSLPVSCKISCAIFCRGFIQPF